jgi:hypothetical protein
VLLQPRRKAISNLGLEVAHALAVMQKGDERSDRQKAEVWVNMANLSNKPVKIPKSTGLALEL